MTHLRTLTLGEIRTAYQLEAGGPVHEQQVAEILVDGRPLSEMLGVRRDLSLIGCGVTHDGAASAEHMIGQYTGAAPPLNQLGSGRVVLYRCHCGADDCGVISFSLCLRAGRVLWRKLAYEDGAGIVEENEVRLSGHDNYRPIDEIAFDRAQYMAEFGRYLRR